MWKLLAAVVGTAAALVAIIGFSYGAGAKTERAAGDARVAALRTDLAEDYANRLDAFVKLNAQASQAHEVKVERINTIYRTITKEASNAITPAMDARYRLPWVYVRLLDAAAEGVEPPPPAADEPDAEPAPIALTAAVATDIDVRKTCHLIREQLIDLQAWNREAAGVP